MIRLSLATDEYIATALDECDPPCPPTPPPPPPAPAPRHRAPSIVKGSGSRSYYIDIAAMTIISINDRGVRRDLTNYIGCPRCKTTAELQAFVAELCALGFYPPSVRDVMLGDIACGSVW